VARRDWNEGQDRNMTTTTQSREPLHRRNDTFLGVCEAIGEDFRIPANLLRLAFAGLFFFQPTGAIALYVVLGLAVFVSRKLFPKVHSDEAAVPPALVPGDVPAAERAPEYAEAA
jgi:phage shock protein C